MTRLRAGAGIRQLVVFLLDEQRYALELAGVERVLPTVAVPPLPGAPSVVLGVINLHGRVVPVADLRQRLGLPSREYGPAGRLLVAHTGRRTVALPVDHVLGVREVAEESIAAPETVLPGIDQLKGIVTLADGVLYIEDLEALLSLGEERLLGEALGEVNG